MKLTQKQRDHFRSHIKDAVLNNVYDELKYYVYESQQLTMFLQKMS